MTLPVKILAWNAYGYWGKAGDGAQTTDRVGQNYQAAQDFVISRLQDHLISDRLAVAYICEHYMVNTGRLAKAMRDAANSEVQAVQWTDSRREAGRVMIANKLAEETGVWLMPGTQTWTTSAPWMVIEGTLYVGVHLDDSDADAGRTQQAQYLLTRINEIGAERVVVFGDFNTSDHNDGAATTFTGAGYTDLNAADIVTTDGGWPADRCMVKGISGAAMSVLASPARGDGAVVSDHKALEIVLP